MPAPWMHRKPGDPTPAEIRSVIQARRDALDQATAQANEGRPLPLFDRWGWKAYVDYLGRSQDGSLLALVYVLDPSGVKVFTRSLRLVKAATLNL